MTRATEKVIKAKKDPQPKVIISTIFFLKYINKYANYFYEFTKYNNYFFIILRTPILALFIIIV